MDLPKFKNQHLLEQAFVHRSYLNEKKYLSDSNERMEFLGDSILSFIVSSYLYENFPLFKEGVLTNIRSNLVNTKTLARISKNKGFGKLLKLSKGEEEGMGRENQSLLADCFEAFIGALFLDQGLEIIKNFILDSLKDELSDLISRKSLKDPKSLLQEKSQAKKLGTPIYKVVGENGPAHERTFTVDVIINNKTTGSGKGKSKQEAEEIAAEIALENNILK